MSKNRLQEAIQIVRKVSWLPHATKQKSIFIKVVAHTKALYGTAVAPFDEQMMAAYRAAVGKMLAPSTINHSLAMVFTSANVGEDIDPLVQVYM